MGIQFGGTFLLSPIPKEGYCVSDDADCQFIKCLAFWPRLMRLLSWLDITTIVVDYCVTIDTHARPFNGGFKDWRRAEGMNWAPTRCLCW